MDVAYAQRGGREQKISGRPNARGGRHSGPGALGSGSREAALSMAWTNWPLFTVGMVQRGYRDEDIQKVLGQNVLRVARAALDGV